MCHAWLLALHVAASACAAADVGDPAADTPVLFQVRASGEQIRLGGDDTEDRTFMVAPEAEGPSAEDADGAWSTTQGTSFDLNCTQQGEPCDESSPRCCTPPGFFWDSAVCKEGRCQLEPAHECRVRGDTAHVVTFDGLEVAHPDAGARWIVKSERVGVQGRYEHAPLTDGFAVLTQMAVSVWDHAIVVGPQDVLFDGSPVFSPLIEELADEADEASGSNNSSNLTRLNYTSSDGSVRLSYDISPDRLNVAHIYIPLISATFVVEQRNEPHVGPFISVTITMPEMQPQDGQCGNRNGDPGDDARSQLRARGADEVAEADALLDAPEAPGSTTAPPAPSTPGRGQEAHTPSEAPPPAPPPANAPVEVQHAPAVAPGPGYPPPVHSPWDAVRRNVTEAPTPEPASTTGAPRGRAARSAAARPGGGALRALIGALGFAVHWAAAPWL